MAEVLSFEPLNLASKQLLLWKLWEEFMHSSQKEVSKLLTGDSHPLPRSRSG